MQNSKLPCQTIGFVNFAFCILHFEFVVAEDVPMSRKLTYDTWLFGAAMLIVVVGLVMIYSASAIIAVQKFGASNPYLFLTRQGVFVIAGGALMRSEEHTSELQ